MYGVCEQVFQPLSTCTFPILNSAKIEIMHYISPVNLHLSTDVTGMSWCANVCRILTDLDS